MDTCLQVLGILALAAFRLRPVTGRRARVLLRRPQARPSAHRPWL